MGGGFGVVAAGVAGAVVGVTIDGPRRRGRFDRPGDPPRRVGAGAVPVATALAWALTAARDTTPPGTGGSVLALTHLAALTLLVAAAAVDADLHRLPDVLVLPAGMIVHAATSLALVPGLGITPTVAWTALAAAVAVPLTALTVTLTIGGLGLGDVKLLWPLAGLLAWSGLDTLTLGLLLGWLSAGLTGTWRWRRGTAGPRSPLPLGPHLLLGTLLALPLT